jgi:hypothetical protein
LKFASEPNNVTAAEQVWYQGGGRVSPWFRSHTLIIEDNGGNPYRTKWFNLTEGVPYYINGVNAAD